jgi:hypothetical protein
MDARLEARVGGGDGRGAGSQTMDGVDFDIGSGAVPRVSHPRQDVAREKTHGDAVGLVDGDGFIGRESGCYGCRDAGGYRAVNV